MVSDASFQMWQKFFDELWPTQHDRRRQDRQMLGRRLRAIATDLELSGQYSDASVLMLAAQELIDNE